MIKNIMKKTMSIFLILIILMNCGILNIIPSFAMTKDEIIEEMENEIKNQGIEIAEIIENTKITDWKVGDSLRSKIGNKWSIKFKPYNALGKKVEKTVKFNECISSSKIPIAGDYILNIVNQDGEDDDTIRAGLNIFSVAITMYPVVVNEEKIKRNTAIGIIIIDIPIEVQKIEISGNNSVYIGENINLEAEITPSDATNQSITWTSSNSNIAKINSKTGQVTGLAKGNVTITATANNGKKATHEIEVKEKEIEVTKVDIVGEKNVYIGETIKLQANITPSDATNKAVVWRINDEDKEFASINFMSGEIKGKKAGTVTVTATSSNEIVGTYEIEVKEKEQEYVKLTNLLLDNTTKNVAVGQEFNLIANFEPENSSNKEIVWTSSEETVATVDENGLVKAVAEGTALITATSKENSEINASCKVIVEKKGIEVEKIKISGANSVKVNSTVELNATVEPENATNKKITWSTNDETIATVDENGNVTGKKDGFVVITATTGNGIKIAHGINIYTENENNEIPVIGLRIEGEKNKLLVEEEMELQAIFSPVNATNKKVAWVSTDENVIEIKETEGGIKVIGKKAGTVTIVAMTSNMKIAAFTVNVEGNENEITNIKIEGDKKSIKAGEEVLLKAIIEPIEATNKNITWKSENDEIATVDENGLVKGKKDGKTTIIAITNNMKIALYDIEVTSDESPVTSIKIESDKNIIEKGDIIKLKAITEPLEATEEILWSSSDENIACVDDSGNVLAEDIGNVKITATTSSGKTAYIELEIIEKEIPVSNVKIQAEKDEIEVDEEMILKAVIEPENATDKNVSWKSDNEEVATVDENGKVTGKKAGTAVITAITKNIRVAAFELKVKEKEIEVKSIKIEGNKNKIEVDEEVQLNSVIEPENATDKNVSWKSSDEEIAIVDENGKVIGKKAGTVEITASKGSLESNKYSIEVVSKKEIDINISADINGSSVKVNEKLHGKVILDAKVLNSDISAILLKIEYPIDYLDITLIEENNMKILSTDDVKKELGSEYEEGVIAIIPNKVISEGEKKVLLQFEIEGIKESLNEEIKISNISVINENGEQTKLNDIKTNITIEKKSNNNPENNQNNNKQDNEKNNNKKDENLYNGNLAHAGKNIITLTGLIMMAISSFILYKKYKIF